VAAKWGGTADALSTFLGCDEKTAIQIGFCRAPEHGEDLEAWAVRVAEQFGLYVMPSVDLDYWTARVYAAKSMRVMRHLAQVLERESS